VGIPDFAKERIFEPFHKEVQSVAGDHGSGLGLSIVKEIVNRLDGQIELKSDLGTGSTFTIILPLLEDEVIFE
jgi:signal transduction histidine kinase